MTIRAALVAVVVGASALAGAVPARAASDPTVVPTGMKDLSCPNQFTCTTYTVRVPDLPDDEDVTIAVSSAPPTLKGTVVFLSGGGGATWWEEGNAKNDAFVGDVAEHGQQLVQVRWHHGWLVAPEGEPIGPARLAARPAAVLRYIHDTVAGGNALEVTGDSGGSSQLAYSLTFHGVDDIVSDAVFTSGPPHAALDKGCLRRPDERAYWYDDESTARIDGSYGFPDGNGPCARHDASFEARWIADSAEAGPDVDWPSTRARFLLGARDRSSAPQHAELFMARLAPGPFDVQYVERMGHGVMRYAPGLRALHDALTDTAR